MSKYTVVRSFYEGNTLHEQDTLFEHSDSDYVAKLLADGNIVEGNNGGSESSAPLVEEVAQATVIEVQQEQSVANEVHSDDTQAQIQEDIALIQ